jgi:anaerobic magnesium-protoporphyrin IX monomethyl ester cyclase
VHKNDMKKVLLLNPPGSRHFIRDYYCSHISKGMYYWPALDLLVLSGFLQEHFEVYVLDAVIDRKNKESTHTRIKQISPDYIISMAAAVSWKQDMQFLNKVRSYSDAPIIISGDYPLAEPEKIISDYHFIDAVLLDFVDSDLIDFMLGHKNKGLRNIFYGQERCKKHEFSGKEFSIALPRHELFPLKSYHLPHILHHPFAVIMTDFGCPFHCTYCPFEKIGYKTRNIDNVLVELKYLSELGIKELWLRDQSFGSNMDHALEFCKAVNSIKKPFSWSCEMRVDAANDKLLEKMKASGCHTVMFGVETANEDILRAHKKGITINQVKLAFMAAKKYNIKTLAHFIIGLEGENFESQKKLIDFCLMLDPDYASFNIAAPLWNTSFRQKLKRDGVISGMDIEVDSSDSYPVWQGYGLSRSDMWMFHHRALKKFYFRPKFIWNQMKCLRTPYRFRSVVTEGLNLIKKTMFR